MIYIGMDIHAKTTTYCAIDDEGHVVKRGKIRSSEEDWIELMGQWCGEEIGVALETGTLTWWIVAVLRGAGIEPVVVDARQFKLISQSKKKSDKHDARALADGLRGGLAERYAVHVPSERARKGRALLKTRYQVVKQTVASRNAARGLLRSVGVSIRVAEWRKSERWEVVLTNPAIPDWMKPLLNTHRGIWEGLQEERARLDNMVKEELSQWSEAEIVSEIPGFGPVATLAFLSHVDDPSRFKRSGQVASYAGLVPSSRDSAESVRRGGITHQGNSVLRHLMVQAAWGALRSKKLTLVLRKWVNRLIYTRGIKKAVVALARRLLTLAHRLWKNGECYDPNYAPETI